MPEQPPAQSSELSGEPAHWPDDVEAIRARGRRSRRKRRRREKEGLVVVLLTVFLAAALLLTAWPWPRHFLHGLADGAEPPRDAWRLRWGADELALGRVLPAHDAPAFYPYAGTFDFDDVLYVPSLIGLALRRADAALAYNVTLLVFWVLSGLTMYLLLRELGVGRAGRVFGTAAFVLVPCRTALLHDMPAQLCFGVPLCLMLLTRWIRTQQRRWAPLLALAFCAQALSTLGYALALAAALPLVAFVALVRRRPSPFDERPLYDGVAIMAVVPLLLLAVFLGPAIDVRTSAAIEHAYAERDPGAAQPLAYLTPHAGSLVRAFSFPVEGDQTNLFPGVAVLLLAGAYGFFQRLMLFKHVRAKRPGQIVITTLAVARIALWIFVGLTCLGRAAAPGASLWRTWGEAVGPALVGILAITLVLALAAPRRQRAFGAAVMHGLGLAAAACFVVSLGPEITAGSPAAPVCAGPLVQPGELGRFLGTIAPLSDVGIVMTVFLVAAAAWILDEIAHHRRFRWFPIPALVLVCAESVVLPNSFQSVRSSTRILTTERFDREAAGRTLFVIPAGDAETDARALLAFAGQPAQMVNGSASITPPAYGELIETFKRGDIEAASTALRELWPEPWIVVDRRAVSEGRSAFTLDEKKLLRWWSLAAEDDRYARYEPSKELPTPLVIRKRMRTDVAARYLRLHLKARMKFVDPSLEPYVEVQWNGKGTQSYALTSELQPLQFEGQERWLGRPEGEVVTISLVFKVGDETTLTPAEEALAGKAVKDPWEVTDLEFWVAPRR
jgi:hypothetical protein